MKIKKDQNNQDLVMLPDIYEWTLKEIPKMTMEQQRLTLDNLKQLEFLKDVIKDKDSALLFQVYLIGSIHAKSMPLDLMAISMSYFLIKKQIGDKDSKPLRDMINDNANAIIEFNGGIIDEDIVHI